MNKKLLLCAFAMLALGALYFAGIPGGTVKADKRTGNRMLTNTPQALPFSQNWTNAGLITANDDWAGVPGIVGFLGNYDAASPANVDPRTLLTPFATNDVDVIANQTSVGITNGGVAEFDTLTNPVVALNGSGTADAPHIIIYVNTAGNTNINFTCNLRDIDDTIDNSAQQVDIQYRVGGAGDYTSVTGGYFADVTSGPSTTMTTPVNVTLPAAANNQSQVEIRVMTTNASANDEWVGVDDISVTGTAAPAQHVLDYDGDGKTDYTVVRNTGGGSGGQITWFVDSSAAPDLYVPWGISTDFFVSGDFDGDDKSDITVWRGGASGVAAFYILQSQTSTVRAELFGQTGDDPTVVGDYNDDGNTDLAVYRSGAVAGDPSFWYWRTTPGGGVFTRQWGQNGDFPAPGDYDGDGQADFSVQRNSGIGQGIFHTLASIGSTYTTTYWGTSSDLILPGDYDGDGKTDYAVARGSGGQIIWSVKVSGGGQDIYGVPWGLSASDFPTQGDYDGDGKTDIAVWRPNANAGANFFHVRRSSLGGAHQATEWGQQGDYPVANYNSH
jgi:hypothetical protein